MKRPRRSLGAFRPARWRVQEAETRQLKPRPDVDARRGRRRDWPDSVAFRAIRAYDGAWGRIRPAVFSKRSLMGAHHVGAKWAGSKWVDGLTADQSVAAAAHRVLELRLGFVWELLPAAAGAGAQVDPEHVHQLRVASRRAHAALELFKECLPRRRARKLGKLLRRVRRAAGAARDFDVQYARLEAFPGGDEVSTRSVLPLVKQRRAKAQAPIVAVHQELARKDFLERVGKFLQRLDERDDATCREPFGRYAAQRLHRAAKRFFAAEAERRRSYSALHRFRIRTKELRYTLEIVAALWEDAVRGDLYPDVEELQDRLGQIVDTHVALDLYRTWLRKARCDGSRCAWRALLAHQRTELARLVSAFDEYWTPERAEGLRSRLLSLAQAPLAVEGEQSALAGDAAAIK